MEPVKIYSIKKDELFYMNNISANSIQWSMGFILVR